MEAKRRRGSSSTTSSPTLAHARVRPKTHEMAAAAPLPFSMGKYKLKPLHLFSGKIEAAPPPVKKVATLKKQTAKPVAAAATAVIFRGRQQHKPLSAKDKNAVILHLLHKADEPAPAHHRKWRSDSHTPSPPRSASQSTPSPSHGSRRAAAAAATDYLSSIGKLKAELKTNVLDARATDYLIEKLVADTNSIHRRWQRQPRDDAETLVYIREMRRVERNERMMTMINAYRANLPFSHVRSLTPSPPRPASPNYW